MKILPLEATLRVDRFWKEVRIYCAWVVEYTHTHNGIICFLKNAVIFVCGSFLERSVYVLCIYIVRGSLNIHTHTHDGIIIVCGHVYRDICLCVASSIISLIAASSWSARSRHGVHHPE